MPRPLTLPRIAATEAQALGRLARHALELPVVSWPQQASPGAPPVLSLHYLGSSSSPLNPEDAVRSRIEWSGCRLALDVPRSAAEDWTRALLGGEAGTSMPGPWRNYALERGMQWVLDSLTACGKGTARMAETALMATGPVEGTRHRFILSLDFPEGAASIHAVLHCDNLGLLMLAGLLPAKAQAAQGPLDLADVPVRLDLSLGYTDLSLHQWQALQPADVVFITRAFFDGPQTLALRVRVPSGPTRRLMAQREGLTLTVTSEALAMSDSADQPDDDDAALGDAAQTDARAGDDEPAEPLGRLMIRLSFDVGHKDLSLDELGRLQPGEVITLERPVTDIVTLRANGTKVGTGTLVEIDGRVGVMLTALASSGGTN